MAAWLAILRVFLSRTPLPGSRSFCPVICCEPSPLAVSLRTWSQQRSYQLKVRAILEDDAKDQKTVVILNHKLVWEEDCVEHEADEQHAQKVWSGCGLEMMSEGLDTPSIQEDSGNHNENDECLNPLEE